jgi:ABC-type glutathione transport system ATPase component
VVIAGETGSGKTTTLAALMRRVLEEPTPILATVGGSAGMCRQTICTPTSPS